MAIINGTAGNDSLGGTADADIINGFEGADTIDGGAGDDFLSGGPGDDLMFAGFGNQVFDGGAGFDRLGFNHLATGLQGRAVPGPGVMIDLTLGVASYTNYSFFSNPPTSITYTYQISNVEGVGGTSASDTIRAGPGGSELSGLAGDDILIGGAGADTLIGGTGQDSLTGGGGADVFQFSASFPASDTPFPFNGAFVDSTAGGIDSIKDFETGVDRVDLSGIQSLSTVTLARSGTGTLIFANTGFSSPGFTLAQTQTVIGVNGLIQGGDIYVSGANYSLQLLGDEGADNLVGGSRNDTLFGLAGSDFLDGGAGDDQLFGDAGADVLTGGAGADRFAYRGFDDSNAKGGFDIITDFTPGTDKLDFTYLNGLSSVSLVRLDGGGTVAFAQTTGGLVQVGFTGAVQGTDLINPIGAPASFGYDLVGGALSEALTGSSGNDRIFGLGGNDVLNGGAGNDTLYGDAGADVLTGGAGADVFAYRSIGDSPLSAFDVITDFVSGTDTISFRGLRASFADKYGVAVQNGSTFVFFDQGGDGTSELLIVLSGVTNLQASDILF